MPAVCDALGIHFDYPDNWELETYDDPSGNGAVVVSSPETAFWQITRHGSDVDPEQLFDEALAALRSEYQTIEAFAAASEVEGQQLSGYDVNFYCLDLTNTCQLRSLATDEAIYMILFQSEDQELQRLAGVFEAMLASLVRSLPDQRRG